MVCDILVRVMGDVVNEDAYISLTDIAKYKNSDNAFIVVANWIVYLFASAFRQEVTLCQNYSEYMAITL